MGYLQTAMGKLERNVDLLTKYICDVSLLIMELLYLVSLRLKILNLIKFDRNMIELTIIKKQITALNGCHRAQCRDQTLEEYYWLRACSK